MTETWLRGLFWKLSSGLRCVLNVDNAFVGVWLSYCHSVTVSSVRYTKHCVDGQPSEHSFVADTCVVFLHSADRRVVLGRGCSRLPKKQTLETFPGQYNKKATPTGVGYFTTLSLFRWFFKIDRREAEKQLMLPGNPRGIFLVRGSAGLSGKSGWDIEASDQLVIAMFKYVCNYIGINMLTRWCKNDRPTSSP